ncbi:amidase [Mycobacterium yunnanensis]|uniref:amidase n=1 Tax=Mycobacterium yunnanensis TaxID=368477 RepID=A0A9X2YQ41_9MYCO|nr:amidase [Mycobacterium yunnanensis]MCV7423418.1 amidase [Mycobacterium yunnanensis]
MTLVSAFDDDALGRLDAVGLTKALASGAVSRVEVVDAAIARTQKVNPQLNGVAFEAFDAARARAAATTRYGGFFDGVPTFVKDNSAVEGMPTMEGTDAWDPRPEPAHGDFARVYLSTGLVALGKSQLSEFGFSAVAEHNRLGAVRNPWNTEYTAGASSSGAGAFVASGAVPIAHANDGGGSIRIPASCNGLVGLKPSRGRLPLDADMRQMPIKIVANGVVTRSVRDTAAFYREAEKVWRSSTLTPIGDVTRPGRARLRIAVFTKSVKRECSPEVREHTLRTAELLERMGHRVDYLDAPPVPASFIDDFLLYWALLAFALVRGGKSRFGETFDRGKLDNLTLGLEAFAAANLHRLPVAVARLATLRRRMLPRVRDYDVLLTPTLAEVPPRVGHLDPTAHYDQIVERLVDWVAFTPLQNVTGDPAISLPLGHSTGGLPVGMMFSARMGHEATLLELAYELEEAVPFTSIAAAVAAESDAGSR